MIEAYAERTHQVINKESHPKKWVQKDAELQTPRVKNLKKYMT